ncbi:PP2C family protein-serine/threonine phosphatase [Longispora albida]|uniref:PP2C family protein-serine/threonine phosphatase n=1 Tax=Longispora albida TaxID=203523 RepID=UPI00037ECB2E|nr:protein phosphatase 2C domain-containing protein [Longispora albida]
MSDRFTLRHAAASDLGLIRQVNEDSLLAGPKLAVIADGVGGEVAGEVASALAIEAMAGLAETAGDPVAAFREAVTAANAKIAAAVEADPALAGMATTLTGLLLSGDKLVLAHAGDSRAYLLREGTLTQITRDDTYIQLLVEDGRISPAEALVHPHRNVVTRVLQGSPMEATYEVRRPVRGDRYLLCSDGLSDLASFEDIAAALRDEPDPHRCTARLIGLALAGGGHDNISVIVVDVEAVASAPKPRKGGLIRGLISAFF